MDPKSALAQFVVQQVLPAAFTVLAGLVTWGATRLVAFLNAKTHDTNVSALLTQITHTVETVVLDVNGTVKAEFEKAAADGSITAEEAKHLRDVALEKTKAYLGAPGLALLTKTLGVAPDKVDAFLGTHVEAAVERINTNAA